MMDGVVAGIGNRIKDLKDECKVVVVGSENQRGVIRVYNEKENLELKF
jgi:hypothetical protein